MVFGPTKISINGSHYKLWTPGYMNSHGMLALNTYHSLPYISWGELLFHGWLTYWGGGGGGGGLFVVACSPFHNQAGMYANWALLHLKFKVCEISFAHNTHVSGKMVEKFCTVPDSITAVFCAKFKNYMSNDLGFMEEQIWRDLSLRRVSDG